MLTNPLNISAEAFALFLKSQRQWAAKPLADSSISSFKARMESFGYDYKQILPHGSYLVNLGNPDKYVSSQQNIQSLS
jgi:AP endonuclease 1